MSFFVDEDMFKWPLGYGKWPKIQIVYLGGFLSQQRSLRYEEVREKGGESLVTRSLKYNVDSFKDIRNKTENRVFIP